jgi:hypothetical protein
MYVDKKLSGVRQYSPYPESTDYPGKEDTFILDFVKN